MGQEHRPSSMALPAVYALLPASASAFVNAGLGMA